MTTDLEGVLGRCAAVLLVGSGALQLWHATEGSALHAALAAVLGSSLVGLGALMAVHPSARAAHIGVLAAAGVVAVWLAGLLGVRGSPDPLTLDLTLAAVASALAAGCLLAYIRASASWSMVPDRSGHLAVVVAALLIGTSWGAAVASSPHDASVTRAGTPAGAAQAPTTTGQADTVGGSHAQHNDDISVEHAAPDVPLDPPTRDQLAEQLVEARQTALRYPTVADAEAAGMIRSGAFSPGAGAHYVLHTDSGGVGPDGAVDPERPGAWLYSGTLPTSRVVGLMYTSTVVDATVASYADGGSKPEGFAGGNDHWHRHFDLCMEATSDAIEVLFSPDVGTTEAACNAAGGELIDSSFWMLHVWVVPGWESPTGVFSHTNPVITCAPGSIADHRGYCEGS